MSFVPVTPYIPPPPSPHTRELSRRLAEVIEQFQRENPGTSAVEVQQALRLAAPGTGASKAVVGVMIGLVLALVLAALVFWKYVAG
jgi:hypothetical protein